MSHEQLICLHREIDFQFDGYVFIRKKDITSRTCYTPSHKYTEALMRKEGFWLKPDRFVRQLDIESWQTTVTALIGKPLMVENENKSAHTWIGIVDACTRTMATVHCFDGLGVFDDDADRIPLRSVTSSNTATDTRKRTTRLKDQDETSDAPKSRIGRFLM